MFFFYQCFILSNNYHPTQHLPRLCGDLLASFVFLGPPLCRFRFTLTALVSVVCRFFIWNVTSLFATCSEPNVVRSLMGNVTAVSFTQLMMCCCNTNAAQYRRFRHVLGWQRSLWYHLWYQLHLTIRFLLINLTPIFFLDSSINRSDLLNILKMIFLYLLIK